MVVPEKTQNIRRVIIPHYVFKGGVLISAFLFVLATVMVLDYANVMHQITENKQLKSENRQLKQEVQVFKDKMLTVENTLDRVKTFATKLRIITNVEDKGNPLTMPSNNAPLLPAPASMPQESSSSEGGFLANPPHSSINNSVPANFGDDDDFDEPKNSSKAHTSLRSILTTTAEGVVLLDDDTSIFVRTEFDRLNKAYEILSETASSQEKEIQEIYESLSDKKSMLLSMPTMMPTAGYISSGFGVRFSPFSGRRKMHEGLDIANRYGADIVSPGDGAVDFAGVKPGYGKIVIIDHGYGLKSLYGHSSAFYVSTGQRVRRGQRIAAVGSTGRSTGPHLHYEIHANGTPIDPMYYLLER